MLFPKIITIQDAYVNTGDNLGETEKTARSIMADQKLSASSHENRICRRRLPSSVW